MIPIKGDQGDWEDVFKLNKQIAKSDIASNVDVVFLGDSITEGWRGTSFGHTSNPRLQGNLEVFESLFSKERGGKFDAVALGISGDKVGVNNSIGLARPGQPIQFRTVHQY
jgi:lysophospholipase L1-like esterase